MKKVCAFLPGVATECEALVEEFFPVIWRLLETEAVCYACMYIVTPSLSLNLWVLYNVYMNACVQLVHNVHTCNVHN